MTVAGAVSEFLPLQRIGGFQLARLPTMENVRGVSYQSFGRSYALRRRRVSHCAAGTGHSPTYGDRFWSGFDDASITGREVLERLAAAADVVLQFARRSSAEEVFRSGRTQRALPVVRSSVI